MANKAFLNEQWVDPVLKQLFRSLGETGETDKTGYQQSQILRELHDWNWAWLLGERTTA